MIAQDQKPSELLTMEQRIWDKLEKAISRELLDIGTSSVNFSANKLEFTYEKARFEVKLRTLKRK